MVIIEFYGKKPNIHETCFIAPNAALIGDIAIDEYSSVWYNAVVRADINQIRIGRRTNIQDNSVLHVEEDYPMQIGDNVLIGHNAVIHGCKIGNGALIGIGAIIFNGAEIGESAIVGIGSLVTENTKIPPKSLALGIPAKIVKELTPQHIDSIKKGVNIYAELAQKHRGLSFKYR